MCKALLASPSQPHLNELSAAARTLDGFGYETLDEEELSFYNGGSVATAASQLSRALATLALTNFDQA